MPYEKNARTQSADQIEQIANSIPEFGFTNPLLVDSEAGILAGHARLCAARSLNLETVPVIVLDHFTDIQKRAYILANNQLALNARWDDNLLAEELARLKMGSREGALVTEVINRTASAHFIGGIPIGDGSKSGAVDPYQRLFGQPGLHVIDGSVMPANPGVNPSLMITALAERAMSLWPNKGDKDPRPPLGSGYDRVEPVMPHRPVVPAGALGELRLDAKRSDIIPEYPY